MNQEINTKQCTKCHQIKSINQFSKRSKSKDHLQHHCKHCQKKRFKLYHNQNLQQETKRRLVWRKNNMLHDQKTNKQWRINNSIYLKTYNKKWHSLHPSNRTPYTNNRRKQDSTFRLLCNIRTRIHRAIQQNYKSGHSLELLGCTIKEYKTYLTNRFTEGMSWDNYGCKTGQWSIDHIIPCSVFDMSDPVEQKQCFHYTNTQPMWHSENMKKHDKILC